MYYSFWILRFAFTGGHFWHSVFLPSGSTSKKCLDRHCHSFSEIIDQYSCMLTESHPTVSLPYNIIFLKSWDHLPKWDCTCLELLSLPGKHFLNVFFHNLTKQPVFFLYHYHSSYWDFPQSLPPTTSTVWLTNRTNDLLIRFPFPPWFILLIFRLRRNYPEPTIRTWIVQ